MRAVTLALAVALLLPGCGGGDDDGDGDDMNGAVDAGEPDAFETICGNPGDPGNSLGVGKFCDTLGDCADTVDAPLCATLGDPLAHFCTKTCSPPADAGVGGPDAGPPECGEETTCTCGNGGCGCTPNVCL